MRLLLIQGGFGAGGAEKVMAMLAAHRAARGDEVHAAALSMPAEGSYFPYPDAVALHPMQTAGAPARGAVQLHRMRHIRQVMGLVQPDLVVSFLTKVNVLTLAAAATLHPSCPVIISERNNPQAQGGHPVWRRAQDLLARRAAAVVMQTQRAREALPCALRARARVIPNPCAPYAGIAPRLDPGRDGLQLAAAGRLDRQKGFDLLLQAMQEIHAALPATRLTIWGEGPERRRLEQLRARLGLQHCVSLPGLCPQPGGWIGEADMLLLSSRYEGFPNVLAEAAVHGLPAVAFDCDYGPRELIRDGENGLLVPPEDPAALARAVIRLARDPGLRQRMSTAAPQAWARLAPDRVLADWDQVIAGAAGPGAAQAAQAASAGSSSSRL
ncbi:glycosyltransferase [Leisingera sp. SS27]|uniref:glycosyltransferase n=1 Tax=Leisingera sp. SS27 TaxID=2979462 RepID=UPI00232F3245|nr:glycosyltransferase [Leisingera sp. SS27]MDC0660390.1 glycosyltransferase [Leisingera sp. SS27]